MTAGSSPSNNVADAASRSYLINGWNDYFFSVLSSSDWASYQAGTYQYGMKQTVIMQPTDVILFGEKSSQAGDFYADLKEGDDIRLVVNESRHDANGADSFVGMGSGGSNYGMVDGSASYIKFPYTLSPQNHWCIGTNQSDPNYVVNFN